MRINKYIASAGIASRRKAENLVSEGRIKMIWATRLMKIRI